MTDNNVRTQATLEGIDRKHTAVIKRRVEEVIAWLRISGRDSHQATPAHSRPSPLALPPNRLPSVRRSLGQLVGHICQPVAKPNLDCRRGDLEDSAFKRPDSDGGMR